MELTNIDAQISDMNAKLMWMLEKQVGLAVLELVKTEPHVADLLASGDVKVRYAALAVSSMNRAINEEIATHCEKLARTDPEQSVRGLALTCLSSFYEKKNNARIGQLFATVVHDENESPDVRWVAYNGLCSLREEAHCSISATKPSSRFPEDADWAWVDSFFS